MKAIETMYKGYRFRSRLEARWAVYLDSLGLNWEYEAQGFDLDGTPYLPDFWLSQVQMWAEVKPEEFSAEELRKLQLLAQHTGRKCIMLVGVPECKAYDFVESISPNECITVDCVLSMYHGYPINEHRFYCSTGGLNPHDFASMGMFNDVPEAVRAARSARFEFGECGRA